MMNIAKIAELTALYFVGSVVGSYIGCAVIRPSLEEMRRHRSLAREYSLTVILFATAFEECVITVVAYAAHTFLHMCSPHAYALGLAVSALIHIPNYFIRSGRVAFAQVIAILPSVLVTLAVCATLPEYITSHAVAHMIHNYIAYRVHKMLSRG